MESPLTGKNMPLRKEERLLEFRKEKFKISYHFHKCEESGEEFTDDTLDILNSTQVHNQYRVKYGIPLVDEIKNIREKYGLSAAKMSDVLGFGANVYRQYESGEMPSVTNGRLIRMAADPQEFKKLLEIGKNALEKHEYEKVSKKVAEADLSWDFIDDVIEDRMFRSKLPDEYSGYKVPNVEKIGNMVKFFAQSVTAAMTKMNKLLFFADFGHYKKFGTSVSGLKYHAIKMGPVPVNYREVYNHLCNLGFFKIQEVDYGLDHMGEEFKPNGKSLELESTDAPFSETEKEILNLVVREFGKMKTKQLIDLSHGEDGWKINHESSEKISYQYAFDLRAI
jgi:putative zinc finger/helix-turn-helix YgiT family protein